MGSGFNDPKGQRRSCRKHGSKVRHESALAASLGHRMRCGCLKMFIMFVIVAVILVTAGRKPY